MSPTDSGVDAIKKALTAFFPPEQVRFRPHPHEKCKPGDRILVIPFLTPDTIRDRLDAAIGSEFWTDEYEVLPTNEVTCTLSVRFGEFWVGKTAVGSSDDRGAKLAPCFDAAFVQAAARFGVGRYLSHLPRIFAKWDGKYVTEQPQIPEGCLPPECRRIGVGRATKLYALIATATSKEQKGDPKNAVRILLSDYSYPANPSDEFEPVTALAAVSERYGQMMTARVNGWINDLGAGLTHSTYSPFYAPPDPAPATTPTTTAVPAEKPKDRPPPKDGGEFLNRLYEYEEKLVLEKLCVKGALLAHVLQQGADHRHPADLTEWNATAIARGVAWAIEFSERCRKAVRPAPAPTASTGAKS